MSLHAYRNIGFSFTESEYTCAKWRKVFTHFNPAQAEQILHLKRDGNYIFITYLHQLYRLNCENGVLEKASSDKENHNKGPDPIAKKWSENLFMNEALVVYHILGDVTPYAGRTGNLVPEAELDPVSVRHGNRTDPLMRKFACDFSGKLDVLNTVCEQCGGKPVPPGTGPRADAHWIFRPFDEVPQIYFLLFFWDGDDEFPARVQVLTDQYITDYMHFEAAGCMIADLFEKICSAAGI